MVVGIQSKSSGGYSNRCISITKWTINHCFRLWFDFVIVFVINIVFFLIFNIEEGMTVRELLKDFLTITQPTWVSWYPKIQIACYIILAISFLINKNGKEWITLAFVLIYIFVMWKLNMASMWYTSVICFLVGLIFAKYSQTIKLTKELLIPLSLISLIIFGGLYYVQSIMYTECLRTISTMFLALFIRIADTKGYDSNFAVISIVIISLIIAYPVNKLVVCVNKKLSSLMNSKTEKRV